MYISDYFPLTGELEKAHKITNKVKSLTLEYSPRTEDSRKNIKPFLEEGNAINAIGEKIKTSLKNKAKLMQEGDVLLNEAQRIKSTVPASERRLIAETLSELYNMNIDHFL